MGLSSPRPAEVDCSSLCSAMQTWRGDIDGWRSTSGVLVFLGSAPISWLSLKQKVVALSTCEAEYVAAATAACQVAWLRRLLCELTGVEAHPPALMVDNQPAIALAKNPVLHDQSKHIDVKFHFLRDYRWRADHHRVCRNW